MKDGQRAWQGPGAWDRMAKGRRLQNPNSQRGEKRNPIPARDGRDRVRTTLQIRRSDMFVDLGFEEGLRNGTDDGVDVFPVFEKENAGD